MARVEKQGGEDFRVLGAESVLEVSAGVVGGGVGLAALQGFDGASFGEREDGEQRRAHPRVQEFASAAGKLCGPSQSAQSAVGGEQVLGVRARMFVKAGVENEGKQFTVTQRIRAALAHALQGMGVALFGQVCTQGDMVRNWLLSRRRRARRRQVILKRQVGHRANSGTRLMHGQANILLGIAGGIGAYKTPMLVRELSRAGATIRTVMTRAAHEFVTPASLQAVSGYEVRSATFDESAEAAMSHIELARWADLILVAPATAHIMARLAHGMADDLLTTIVLASNAPVVLAPAMNTHMWSHAATQANLKKLGELGYSILGPDVGEQACGDEGPGRLVEPQALAAEVAAIWMARSSLDGALRGRKVLVTAGPTREAIDPVRYITNHSSGRQGFAMCRAAAQAGAEVTLVSGPVGLETPTGVERIDVVSASDMRDAVMTRAPRMDMVIAVAAVSDFAPVKLAEHKIKKKKSQGNWQLELAANPDVLAEVAALEEAPFTVGFAAETRDVEHNARNKLEAKGIDMIAVNDVGNQAIGFNSANNAMTLMWRQAADVGSERLALSSKDEIAARIIARAAERLNAKGGIRHG